MVGWKLNTVGSFTIVTNYCAWSLTMKFLWENIFPTFWSMSNSRNSIKNHKFGKARLIKLKNHMPLLPFKTSNTIKFHTIGWIVWFYECNSHTCHRNNTYLIVHHLVLVVILVCILGLLKSAIVFTATIL